MSEDQVNAWMFGNLRTVAEHARKGAKCVAVQEPQRDPTTDAREDVPFVYVEIEAWAKKNRPALVSMWAALDTLLDLAYEGTGTFAGPEAYRTIVGWVKENRRELEGLAERLRKMASASPRPEPYRKDLAAIQWLLDL